MVAMYTFVLVGLPEFYFCFTSATRVYFWFGFGFVLKTTTKTDA